MHENLTIAGLNLSSKDEMVLRALVRLLDGTLGVGLRFEDDPSKGQVVFTCQDAAGSHGFSATAVVVHVMESPALASRSRSGFTVQSPLRMSGVIGALQAVLEQKAPVAPAEHGAWRQSLFAGLREAMRRTGRFALPLEAGHLLLLNTDSRRVQTDLSLDQLIGQAHRAGSWRTASAVDEEILHGAPVHSLHDLMWRLSAVMVTSQIAPKAGGGAWRLHRWPTATGLMTPGHPRLAAMLTQRPHSVDQLIAISGLPSATVHAFVATAEALGLTDYEATRTADVAVESAPPSWFGQLRERLKLW